MLADLSAQQIDFVIDLVQPYQAHLQFENLIEDHFVACTQQAEMDLSLYLSSPHIGVHHGVQVISTGIDHLIANNCLDKFFYAASTIRHSFTGLAQHPNAILTIPQAIPKH